MGKTLAPDIVVPTNEKPTFWNRTAAAGAAIGSMGGPIGAVVGGLIGGFMGKNRMEKDLAFGKTVSEPSFWNADTAIGWAIGGVLAAPVVLSLLAFNLPVIAVGVALAGALAGVVIGGKHGENRLAKEYQQAQQFALAQSQAAVRGHGNPYTVTPEEAQLLESRLLGNAEKSMVEKLAGKDPRYADRAQSPT